MFQQRLKIMLTRNCGSSKDTVDPKAFRLTCSIQSKQNEASKTYWWNKINCEQDRLYLCEYLPMFKQTLAD